MAKSWKCELCGESISELAAYCKRSISAYRHMSCHSEAVFNAGIKQGREQILNEQAEAKRAAEAEEDRKTREFFVALPRCTRCGVRIHAMGTSDALRKLGEVRQSSGSTPGVCSQCVREEVQARAAARVTRGAVTPAQAIQQAPTAPVEAAKKPEEPSKDRFSLIDMD